MSSPSVSGTGGRRPRRKSEGHRDEPAHHRCQHPQHRISAEHTLGLWCTEASRDRFRSRPTDSTEGRGRAMHLTRHNISRGNTPKNARRAEVYVQGLHRADSFFTGGGKRGIVELRQRRRLPRYSSSHWCTERPPHEVCDAQSEYHCAIKQHDGLLPNTSALSHHRLHGTP
jgi:hypothetical protein